MTISTIYMCVSWRNDWKTIWKDTNGKNDDVQLRDEKKYEFKRVKDLIRKKYTHAHNGVCVILSAFLVVVVVVIMIIIHIAPRQRYTNAYVCMYIFGICTSICRTDILIYFILFIFPNHLPRI